MQYSQYNQAPTLISLTSGAIELTDFAMHSFSLFQLPDLKIPCHAEYQDCRFSVDVVAYVGNDDGTGLN